MSRGPLFPLVRVDLHGSNGTRATISGLIDSGADCSCFPLGWAQPLGIDLDGCEERRGATAGGLKTQYWWPPGLHATIADVELRLTAVFGETPIALLGRQDFFRTFGVHFDERASVFTLEVYDSGQTSSEKDETATSTATSAEANPSQDDAE